MKSIRRHLTIDLFWAVVLLQGAGLVAVYWLARTGTVAEFDISLRAKALAVSTLIVYTPTGVRTDMADFYLGVGDTDALRRRLKPSDAESYRRFLQEFQHHGRHNYFELWDAAGHPLARSESLGGADLPRRVGAPNKALVWDYAEPNGEPGRAIGFVFQPEVVGTGPASGARTGPLQLVVAAEREALDDKLTRLLLLISTCGVCLLGGAFWLMPRVLRRGLAPLHRLSEEVARIDAGSLAIRFSTASSPSELHPIIERLNDLLARLAQSFERERRFSADVAHELRTPLAELMAVVELALKWPESRDPSTDREILDIARQLQTILERMLALARGEMRRIAVRLEPVAIEPAIQGVWRTFAGRAEANRVTCRFTAEPVVARADAALLKSILTIVLENAVSYAPPGSEIHLGAHRDGTRALVVVSNLAPELGHDDIDKMFDRLWRKDLARTGGAGHLGIGLALARSYASAMEWDISAALEENQRLTLTLSGEAAPNPTPAVMVP